MPASFLFHASSPGFARTMTVMFAETASPSNASLAAFCSSGPVLLAMVSISCIRDCSAGLVLPACTNADNSFSCVAYSLRDSVSCLLCSLERVASTASSITTERL